MRILIAPDKFKGSLTAREVAAAIGRGARRVFPEATIIEQPMADGGEGSLELLQQILPLQTYRLEVTGPLRKKVMAEYLMGEGKAFIEVARACGLQHLPPHRRDPGRTTTIGVGMLIEDALARGARDISLFLGGSATNDCGAGMAAALGYRFFGNRPEDFVPTGDSLGYVLRIDDAEVMPAVKDARFTAVCDVDNPLLGDRGATMVYASQKGAKLTDLPVLEEHMERFSGVLAQFSGTSVLVPGSGAAGGLGAGIRAFLGGDIQSGIDRMMEVTGLEKWLIGADLVITGEGCIDDQTPHGKVVSGVAGRAQHAGAKVLAVAGRCTLDQAASRMPDVHQIAALMDQPGMTIERSMGDTALELEGMVVGLLRSLKI
ncbi:glycerate kinase [Neolewinella agarilytica]|uniref:Glycerate kinase n=1 Tax=Neolewinella agarilytica TaxID=478744 RepID=A0A1H9M7M9_9BACT|nr:glycerate kinase [Neolewinella agarilytica]SER19632.1 glycerate kinase [Neolewinella agarilytica]